MQQIDSVGKQEGWDRKDGSVLQIGMCEMDLL